ncbi:hypothetical protein GCM10011335_23150 [Aureimonas glaciei]|uniref:Uncharacterized protein n=1 Tax=Aureimonas glaciei TaxID=1776957 RepID=A0A916XXI5_9HYPH|nr:hypothetical protein GCM10011335_23150 [Aureimonas glaciei]
MGDDVQTAPREPSGHAGSHRTEADQGDAADHRTTPPGWDAVTHPFAEAGKRTGAPVSSSRIKLSPLS